MRIKLGKIVVEQVNPSTTDKDIAIAKVIQPATIIINGEELTNYRETLIQVPATFNKQQVQERVESRAPNGVLYKIMSPRLDKMLIKQQLDLAKRQKSLDALNQLIDKWITMYQVTPNIYVRYIFSNEPKDDLNWFDEPYMGTDRLQQIVDSLERIEVGEDDDPERELVGDPFEYLEVVTRDYEPDWQYDKEWIYCIYNEPTQTEVVNDVLQIIEGQRHYINMSDWQSNIDRFALVKVKAKHSGILTLDEGFRWRMTKGEIRYKLMDRNTDVASVRA